MEKALTHPGLQRHHHRKREEEEEGGEDEEEEEEEGEEEEREEGEGEEEEEKGSCLGALFSANYEYGDRGDVTYSYMRAIGWQSRPLPLRFKENYEN
jgi:hypothetical protein